MNFPDTLRKQWHGKRYNSYNRLLKDTFDARVYKIGLRLDFTCPNRDGTVAVGGCIYCNNSSHTPQNYEPRTSVTNNLSAGWRRFNDVIEPRNSSPIFRVTQTPMVQSLSSKSSTGKR
jgi:radical SAM superfamily enzyme